MRGCGIRASLRGKAKPIAIKGCRSKCGGGGAKAATLTRGGLQVCPRRTRDFVRDLDGPAEVSRGRTRTAGRSEGPNM